MNSLKDTIATKFQELSFFITNHYHPGIPFKPRLKAAQQFIIGIPLSNVDNATFKSLTEFISSAENLLNSSIIPSSDYNALLRFILKLANCPGFADILSNETQILAVLFNKMIPKRVNISEETIDLLLILCDTSILPTWSSQWFFILWRFSAYSSQALNQNTIALLILSMRYDLVYPAV
ncbi:hypothetical protein GJ496_007984, partial [Pomphorhynchus laevis]